MNRNLLQQAIKAMAIRDVYFKLAHAEVKEEFDPLSSQEPLAVQFRTAVRDVQLILDQDEGDEGKSISLVRIVADCGMRLIPSESSGSTNVEHCVDVRAVLVSEYELLDDLKKESIDEFARNNGLFHIWPFWREYVHSCCARFRIPAIPVPMYQVPSERENSDGEKSVEKEVRQSKKARNRAAA